MHAAVRHKVCVKLLKPCPADAGFSAVDEAVAYSCVVLRELMSVGLWQDSCGKQLLGCSKPVDPGSFGYLPCYHFSTVHAPDVLCEMHLSVVNVFCIFLLGAYS